MKIPGKQKGQITVQAGNMAKYMYGNKKASKRRQPKGRGKK
ncbi:hypothetical protein QA584_22830 [Anaerocolumna sp. AGMB13025]|nr:hypothetical protein [Anaerocolumna sp. AGMB13025]WFR56420.1 hypothetical protein QA584_22830 [Anaerocolumna sp. AGMB13025]